MSKTQKIEVQGLIFETPPIPKKSEIYLSELPKKEQYWRRRSLPDKLDGMTDKEINDFVKQEWGYLLNGFWYMNNGEPNYLTGANYFFLQYNILQHGEYGDYRETDRDFFYFWNLVENNKKAIGVIALKFRRRGLSSIATAIALYIALTEENRHCGLMSKDAETARDGLFKEMVINSYGKLPQWVKPRNSGTDRSAKELIFLKQAERISKANKGTNNEDLGLNNKITYRANSLNAYDGQNLRYLIIDECGKWKPDVPIERYYPIAKKCCLRGAKRVGMMFLLSTANELESGGKGFKDLWDKSDHTKKEYDGITPTGLYRYFMPAYVGFHGYFNKYGQPIIDTPTKEEAEYLKEKGEVLYTDIGSKEYLEKEREKIKGNPEDLADECRMNPFTPKEAFFQKSNNCIVNPLQINEQLDFIDSNKIPIRRGRFYRDLSTEKVKFMDVPDGEWEILWMPDESEANQYKVIYGKKKPLNIHKGCIGCDPVASSQGAAYGEESRGVALIKRSFNPIDPENSDMPVAALNFRPRLKRLFHEQVFLAAEYYGYLAAYEAVIDDFFDFAIENGYDNYMVYAPDQLVGSRATQRKAGIPATSAKSREYHTLSLISDFNSNYEKYYFKDLLLDYIDFDVEHRNPYDFCMSWGYAIIGEESCRVRNVLPEETSKKPFLKKYSYSGRI